MQDIMPENVSVVLNGLHDHVCNGWLAQVERTIAGFVQQPVHGGKCLPGVDRAGRESPVGRQTIVETPREEDGPFRVIDVRKSPPGECHTRVVPQAARNSHLQRADRGSAADQGVCPTGYRAVVCSTAASTARATSSGARPPSTVRTAASPYHPNTGPVSAR